MHRAEREGIVSKVLICSVFCGSVAGFLLAADARAALPAATQAWGESPDRNFHRAQGILGGRVLVSDEADDPALAADLAREIKALQSELHDRQGWRAPLRDGDPLRVF